MDDRNDPPSWTRTWNYVLDLISSQSKKQITGMDTVMVSDDDCARTSLAHARSSIRGRYPDIVWEGCDASLIESKTKGVPKVRKRKRKSKAAALKGSRSSLCEAEALELALTLRGMVCFDFPNWQKLLSPKLYESVHDSVFSNIAKFVLNVFDPEDFERIFNLETSSAGRFRACDGNMKFILAFDGACIGRDEEKLGKMSNSWSCSSMLPNWLKIKRVEDFRGFEHLKLYTEDAEPRAFAIKLLDEFVEAAYIERRTQGHRFINIENFLFNLSLSRVAKPIHRILDGKGLKRNIGKHLKVEVPSWKITIYL
ncbi:hypothetical protein RHGRI_005166 [Rhododendron griersonianum]|uniref:Uncharacterized protein n=1 Tax=Rhododendron griersonianum TaxID=479676 RepID=A0AAV6LCA3_9ERIC|nr:hypothetical protein RHGRI_005166 [Rhododendron griersonianum]